MIPQDFVREYSRMCNTYKSAGSSCGYSEDCKPDCPLYRFDCRPHIMINCSNLKHFSSIYDEVEKWSNTRLLATRQSEFLKMFPNTKIKNGILDICPVIYEKDFLDKEFHCPSGGCGACRKNYWSEPAEKER